LPAAKRINGFEGRVTVSEWPFGKLGVERIDEQEGAGEFAKTRVLSCLWKTMRRRRRVACWLAALVLGGVAVSGCNFEGDQVIGITYVNNTDSELCRYHATAELLTTYPASEFDCSDLGPMTATTLGDRCEYGIDRSAVLVVLVEKGTGKPIYDSVASCDQWQDAGSTITIDQRDGGFLVTDGFPEIPPKPATD
jgi:hypothetical protein